MGGIVELIPIENLDDVETSDFEISDEFLDLERELLEKEIKRNKTLQEFIGDFEKQQFMSETPNSRENIFLENQDMLNNYLYESGVKFDGFENEEERILSLRRLNTDKYGIEISEIDDLSIDQFIKNKVKNSINSELVLEERPVKWIDKVVLHSTANNPKNNPTIQQSINQINGTNDKKPKAHFFIYSSGQIHQTATLSSIINHAGKSSHNGDGRLDKSSIGIEVETIEYGEWNQNQIQSVQKLLVALGSVCPNITKGNVIPHSLVGFSEFGLGRKSDPVDKAGNLFTELGLPNQWSKYNYDLILGITSDNLENIQNDKGWNPNMYEGIKKTKERILANPEKVKELRNKYAEEIIQSAKDSKNGQNYSIRPDSKIKEYSAEILYILRKNGAYKSLIVPIKFADLKKGDEIIWTEKINANVGSNGLEYTLNAIVEEQRGLLTPKLNPFYDTGNIPYVPCSHVIRQLMWRSYLGQEEKLTPQTRQFFEETVDARDFFDGLEKIGYGKVFDLKNNFNLTQSGLLSGNPIKDKKNYEQEILLSQEKLRSAKPGVLIGFYYKGSDYHSSIVNTNKNKVEKRGNTHMAISLGQVENSYSVKNIQEVFKIKGLGEIPKSIKTKEESADFLSKIVFARSQSHSASKIGTIKNNLLQKYGDNVDIKIQGKDGKFYNRKEFSGEISDDTKVVFNGTLLYDYVGLARTLFYWEFMLLGDYLPTEAYELKQESAFFREKLNKPYETELSQLGVISESSTKNSYWLKKEDSLKDVLNLQINKIFEKLLSEGKIESLPDTSTKNKIIDLQSRILYLQGYKTNKMIYHKYFPFYDVFDIEEGKVKIRNGLEESISRLENLAYNKFVGAQREENLLKIQNDKTLDVQINLEIASGEYFIDFISKVSNEIEFYSKKIKKIGELEVLNFFPKIYGNPELKKNFGFFLFKNKFGTDFAQKFTNSDIKIFLAGNSYKFTIKEICQAIENVKIWQKSHIPEAKVDPIEEEIVSLLGTSEKNENILKMIARKEGYTDGLGKRKFSKYFLEGIENKSKAESSNPVIMAMGRDEKEFVSSRGLHQLRFDVNDLKNENEIERPSRNDLIDSFNFILGNHKDLQDKYKSFWGDSESEIENDLELVKNLKNEIETEPFSLQKYKDVVNKMKDLLELEYRQGSGVAGKMLSYFLTNRYISINQNKITSFLKQTNEDGIGLDPKQNKEMQLAVMRMHNLGQNSTMYGFAINYLMRIVEFGGEETKSLSGMKLEESDSKVKSFVKGKSFSLDEKQFKKNIKEILYTVQNSKNPNLNKVSPLVEEFYNTVNSSNYWNKMIELVKKIKSLNLDGLNTNFLPTETEISDPKSRFRTQFFDYVNKLNRYKNSSQENLGTQATLKLLENGLIV